MIYYIIIISIIALFVFFIGLRIYNENESDLTKTVIENETIDFSKSSNSKTEKIIINPDAYSLPAEEEIKALLNDLQFDVTQNCGTERAFENEYWNNYEKGIYVDIVTGEPLFFSSDKFKSGTGWPSFTKPVSSDVVTLVEDNSLFMSRIEVKSRIGNTHLGHVFEDGPDEEGGLRYCINSAAIRFIPYDEMKKNGYEHLMKYLDQVK
ncbi:MAG: peptide methionine sulfoxide reductase msrA/msrB [Kosmotogales bacterium]|nr:peptide methionine sulfoxide reductase msrA/msrB [Kosmotogales bacterium]